MSSNQSQLPTRRFSDEELGELVQYLNSDCSPAPVNPDGTAASTDHLDFGGPIAAKYSDYIERFANFLNKDPKHNETAAHHHRSARVALRQLIQSRGLPRCQMMEMCTYLDLCVDMQIELRNAEVVVEKKNDTTKDIKSFSLQIDKLRESFHKQEAALRDASIELKIYEDAYAIIDLMSASLSAIHEIHVKAMEKYRLDSIKKRDASMRRKDREQILDPPGHPEGCRATAEDAEHILVVLHRAIIGQYPNKTMKKYFKPANTRRDKSRSTEDSNRVKWNKLIDRLEAIAPGFREVDNLDDIQKIPLEVSLSDDSSEIVWLSELHSAYTRVPDKAAFREWLQDLSSRVTEEQFHKRGLGEILSRLQEVGL